MANLGRNTLLAGGALVAAPGTTAVASPDDDVQNLLSAAGAWRRTATQRDMLYLQGFIR